MRPAPEVRRYEGWSFRVVRGGRRGAARDGAGRRVARRGAPVGRGGDARCRSRWPRRGGATERAGQRLPARARPRGRLPGDRGLRGRRGGASSAAALHASRCCAPAAGCALGASPGEAWVRSRYAGPTCATTLLDRGVMVETLETAASWSQPADALRGRRRRSARARCRARHAAAGDVPRLAPVPLRRLALLHVPGRARSRGAELEQWRAAKTAASDAIVAQRRDDHPPPRDRPRPRALAAGARSATRGSTCSARPSSAWTPRGS